MTYPRRWFLSGLSSSKGEAVDDYQFKRGNPVDVFEPLRISVQIPGRVLDFTHWPLPIVKPRVADIIEAMDPHAIQRIPIKVIGHDEPFEVMNVIARLDCIDRSVTKIRMWTEEDGFPELVGKYKAVEWLKVDPSKVGGSHIFLIEKWTVAMVVSDVLRESLVSTHVTAISFLPL